MMAQKTRFIIFFSTFYLWTTPLWAYLVDPTMPQTHKSSTQWTLRSSQGQVPQQDYTMTIIYSQRDILTGGPLAYGPPLSGITDIIGPDRKDIASYLDSVEGLQNRKNTLSRYTHHHHQPQALGTYSNLAPNMIKLTPQQTWMLQTSSLAKSKQLLLMDIAVPEPSTIAFLCLGTAWLAYRRK